MIWLYCSFETLEQSEEGTLEGPQLEEALRSILVEHEDVTEEKLRYSPTVIYFLFNTLFCFFVFFVVGL